MNVLDEAILLPKCFHAVSQNMYGVSPEPTGAYGTRLRDSLESVQMGWQEARLVSENCFKPADIFERFKFRGRAGPNPPNRAGLDDAANLGTVRAWRKPPTIGRRRIPLTGVLRQASVRWDLANVCKMEYGCAV